MIPVRALIAMAVVAAAFASGWTAQGWRADAEISQLKEQHSAELKAASDAAAEAEREHRRQVEIWSGHVSQIDEKLTKEKADAQAQIDDLVERVRIGNRRLSVRANCPAGGSGTAAAPGPSGSPDAAPRAELHPADSEALLRIGADADDTARTLNALQQYVRDVCLK